MQKQENIICFEKKDTAAFCRCMQKTREKIELVTPFDFLLRHFSLSGAKSKLRFIPKQFAFRFNAFRAHRAVTRTNSVTIHFSTHESEFSKGRYTFATIALNTGEDETRC